VDVEELFIGVGNEIPGGVRSNGELSSFYWATISCAQFLQWVKSVRYCGGEINEGFVIEASKALRTSHTI
jgi:hypothetical protein